MKKLFLSILGFLFISTSVMAQEVNIFSARHYDSDVQLYKKFTAKTGIKVNVVSGKDKALQKRIKEEEERLRQWEIKFDEEQKKREEELIRKF